MEELVSSRLDHHHVTEYDGAPCPLQRGPCRHGGRCVPRLNDFDCQCTAGFTGRLCQTCTYVYCGSSVYSRIYGKILSNTLVSICNFRNACEDVANVYVNVLLLQKTLKISKLFSDLVVLLCRWFLLAVS